MKGKNVMIKKFIYGFFIFGFVGASFECFKMFKSSNKAEDWNGFNSRINNGFLVEVED